MKSLETYLYELEMEGSLGKPLANLVTKNWGLLESTIYKKGYRLERPDACPGYRDNFMFTWRNSKHYLEVEIFLDGRLEFFYYKLGPIEPPGISSHEDLWGEDTTIDTPLSSSIINKLLLFSHE